MKHRWQVFTSSIFFVLGFSTVFAIAGILLQTVLSSVSYSAQKWMARVGGVLIILFGLYLLGLIKVGFLEKEHKISVKKKFKFVYLTSFIFGAAFAVGWTPCVGAVLGAVLTLAATSPSVALPMLIAYSLGLGMPFLLVGLFADRAGIWINKTGSWIKYLNYVFGAILVFVGILVFTSQLSLIASFSFASDFLISVDGALAGPQGSLNIGIAFIAGFVSFLSPCVLPLIPAFLAYLASITVKHNSKPE